MAAQKDIKIIFHQSLVVRSLASTSLLLAVIAALTVYFSAADIQQKALQELNESTAYFTQNVARGLVAPVLRKDSAAMRRQLKVFDAGASKDFCGTEIRDAQNKVIFRGGFPARFAKGEFSLHQPIQYAGTGSAAQGQKTLGSIWLCMKQSLVEKKINDMIFRELSRFAIIMFIVWAAVYTSMQILIRPLQGIHKAMGGVAQTMKPISDPDLLRNNEVGVLAQGFNSMVIDLAETYNALEIARQRAIKSENAKSDFLANMSHELRSPLNNIIGSVQLLHDRPLEAKDREMFTIIEKSSASLLGIVNDILDLSKIEAGQVRLENIRFDAFEKIRDVAQAFLPQASKKGLLLTCATGDGPLFVMGDPMRFERVLTNLAGNALRYTDHGSIRIVANARITESGAAVVRCEVTDTGIGIPKDRQDKIFNRFAQAEDSTARRYGGTGLGLTITRELIHLMRGVVGLESEVGKGTTFWVEMPFAPAPPDGQGEAQKNEGAGRQKVQGKAVAANQAKVLVAEDHEINRTFMRRLFESIGIVDYIFAVNGKDAVEEVMKGKFDLVLMDCHMPEMDGYTATAAIRGLPDAFQGRVPIVAMTANAMAEDEKRCLAAGMDSYISKPFEINAFKAVLSPWIDFDTAGQPAAKRQDDDSLPADLEILKSSSMGDKAFLKEMIDLFMVTAEKHIKELDTLSGARGSPSAWIESAHGLKGVAGIVGAKKLQQLAAQAQVMDDTAKSKRKAAVKAIEEEYAALKEFLVKL